MKRIIPALLALALLLSVSVPAMAAGDDRIRLLFEETAQYMESRGELTAGTVGGEWTVLGFARSGRTVPEDYYGKAVAYITEKIDENERLHPSKCSLNCRFIVALTAIGKNPADVAGHNLLAGLNDMNYVRKVGISGLVWTLLAFDCGGYETPRGISREELVDEILKLRVSAGWANAGEIPDPDMTAMTLQALAPYREKRSDVKAAVDRAVELLSEMQDETGNFPGQYGASSESVSQIIVALTTLGIDPHTDPRFVKGGVSAVDGLLGYAVDGGGFRHIGTGKVDGVATEQGYYALTAYFRFLEGKTPLYQMGDAAHGESKMPQESKGDTRESMWVWLVLGGGAVLLASCFLLKKRLGRQKFANAVMVVVILTMGALGVGYALGQMQGQEQPALGSLYQIQEIPENRLVSSENPTNICTVTVRCHTVLEHLELLEAAKVPYVPADGVILPEITVEFTPGETAFDVMRRACEAADIPMEYSWSPLYDSYYLEGVNYLYEFDCGAESGWMYLVNGAMPNYGASSWEVQTGDRIVWAYSCIGLGADLTPERKETA